MNEHSMVKAENSHKISLLDGGMGRELMRMGAPFRQPEWSALSLMEAPEFVRKAHEFYGEAGSDIITTSNYAVVPFHLGEERFLSEGDKLTELSGQLARGAASKYGCRVAGSIPPLFGSYRSDLFSHTRTPVFLRIIIKALSPHVDLWLSETISSISEARAVAKALSKDNLPLWISFTLLDGEKAEEKTPRLRSGEKVSTAVNAAIKFNTSAILFNCSQPEVMSPAIKTAMKEMKRLDAYKPIGVYANAFPAQKKDVQANSTLQRIRSDLDPAEYLNFVKTWCRLGATIIGGCCGIGPEHIATLHNWLKEYGVKND
jgi:S-methylmethionine-dependent homocysteine/selenocysteine methylase